jgi:nitroimidazol reductase NimA-like FMN-containing flavoprotein (pyridoxamine 5'-phosphate oxidase superfamily)
MFGSLSNSEIETLLHSQVVGRMGCHADNLTYVVPISYAYDGTYIYTRTFEGMKVNIIRKSPEVCFQVDDMHDLANWQSVIAWGTVEELSGKEQCGKALEILSARVLPFLSSETMHLSPVWPFSAGSESIPGIFLRILLERKTGRFERLEPASFFAS